MNTYINSKRIILCAIWMTILTTLSFGQSFARYSPATKNLEFRISSTTKDKIKSVQLYDSKNSQTTLIALGRINPIMLGGLQISLNAGEEPLNLATDPVILTIIVEPDPQKNIRTAVSLQVYAVGALGSTELVNTAPEGRDDANVYISGEAIVEHKQSPQFSLDVKLQKEIALKDVPLRVAPFLELKATNDDGATDKSNGGVRFISTANRIRYEGSGEIESDYKFRVTNFLTSQEVKYLIPAIRFPSIGNPNAILFPRVFIGAELGTNLRSPILRDSRGIARLKAGATLTLKIFEPFKKLSFLDLGVQKLIWDNRFEQRWFLIKEQAYDTEDDQLILRDFGRKPRGHFSSSLHFMFNDFFGPSVKYEWGQLPPLYKKVDHRVTFGLTFSLSRSPE